MPSIRRRKYWTTQQRHKEFTSLTAYQPFETCRDKPCTPSLTRRHATAS